MTDVASSPEDLRRLRERRREFAQKAALRLKTLEDEFKPDPACPLITPYTQFLEIPEEDLRRLYAIRRAPVATPVDLPPMPRLRTVIEDTGQPLDLRNYQKAMVAHMAVMPRFVNGDGVGLGKAQPLDAPILTPMGWRAMGDLRVGDPVVDPDGGEAEVTGVFPQGDKESLEVTFSDGSTVECCDEHLWTVQTVHDRGREAFRTLTLREMLDQGLTGTARGAWRRNKFFLPKTPPVVFDPLVDPLLIPPYALGVLLGDGCIRYNIALSTPSEGVLQAIRGLLPEGGTLRHKSGCDWGVPGCPSWLRELEAYNLRGAYSYTKHVPEPYLYASPGDRTSLLQGLMDTDGECSKDGLAYYRTTSPELRDAVVTLTRSLGGVATVSQERRKTYTYKGEKRVGRPSWAVTVKTPFNPFLCREERRDRWKPQMLARALVSVKSTGLKPMQCISVSSKRQLYFTKDFVPTHNTLCAIAAACAVDHQLGGQRVKVVVLTTNATAYQWETEIKRFSTLNPWVLRDAYKFKGDRKTTYGHEARMIQLRKFLEHPRLDVCVCRYSQWMGRRRAATGALDRDGRPVNHETGKEVLSEEARDFRDAFSGMKDRLILVLDETHKIKAPDGLLRNIVLSVQRKFGRVWGLTATAIKNNLEEFYAIFSALGVSPLGSLPHFRENFCEWQAANYAGRTEYKIIGYTRIPEFRVGMRPWFWGRSQAQVGEPLPKLTTIYHPVELSKEQAKLLLEDIPSGAYVLPPAMKLVAGEIELVERDPSNLMTALSVMAAVTNSPALLDVHDPKTFLAPKLSPKEELLLDLLDGDYRDEQVIMFTKFRSWIDRLEHLTRARKFTARPFLRITGNEGGSTREKNRKLFQDPGNDYTFIAINSAGIEGVNLQQAAHLIALDLPWSWGDLIQLVGRMVRMASPHSACTLHIFYGLGTIDEYVIETQRGKKGVFERILGSAGTAGLLDAEDLSQDLESTALGLENESDDNFKDMLRAHAKKIGIRPFVFGDQLAFRQMAGVKTPTSNLKGPQQATERDLDAVW